ncbi:MAG TPA: DUF6178 family protein [Myxococcaceae bacterium]|nr:DUF6178 family protein [Myxococcaceae bacterium]
MTNEGNGHDRALARHETVRRLAQLPPKQRLDALAEAPNARELVRATPAEELYYAIADVGLADSTEIVQLASPEQFRTFVDLGGWRRHRIDPHEVLSWLRAARAEGGEHFLRKLRTLDLEVVEFMIRRFVTIHDREENPDLNPPGVTMETPEGRYLLEFHVEGPELAALRAMLSDLFAQDAFEAVRLLEAARWEVPSELEETALRFRSARLEDLGFPPLDEAVALFAWVDPQSVRWSRPERPAGAVLARAEGANFVDAAVRGLDPDERVGFEFELRSLSNAALVAEIEDPGDLAAVRRVGEMVRDYLSLGLEHLTGGDPSLGADCLREVPTRKVFQVGFSLTLRLAFQVDRLAKQPLAMVAGAWLALEPETRVLRALRQKRPMRALDAEGTFQPFRDSAELDEAQRAVERAGTQIAFFRSALGGSEASAREALATFGQSLEALGTDRLLAAVVAQAMLDGVVRARPVPSNRVAELCERLFEGTAEAPVLRPEPAARAASVLKSGLDPETARGVGPLLDRALERLRTELGPAWLTERKLHPALGEILPIAGIARR